MEIHILRLGHRASRDKRITTHVCLVARAFGAKKAVITGDKDEGIIQSVEKVVEQWGGDFKAEYAKGWRAVVEDYKKRGFEVIHLTMYGLPIQEVIGEAVKNGRDKLLVIGGEKVPSELYQIADKNVAVTNQPHSEISALCIAIDRLHRGGELDLKQAGNRLEIVPKKAGKLVVKK